MVVAQKQMRAAQQHAETRHATHVCKRPTPCQGLSSSRHRKERFKENKQKQQREQQPTHSPSSTLSSLDPCRGDDDVLAGRPVR